MDTPPRRPTQHTERPAPAARRAPPAWYAAMTAGGLAFGLIGERRPFGSDVLAHPLILFFCAAGAGLLALRVWLARPVPEVIPERALLFGCFAGLAGFLLGNWLAVRLPLPG